MLRTQPEREREMLFFVLLYTQNMPANCKARFAYQQPDLEHAENINPGHPGTVHGRRGGSHFIHRRGRDRETSLHVCP